MRESEAGSRSVRWRHGPGLVPGMLFVALAVSGGLQGQQGESDETACPAYEPRLGTPMETVRYLADDALGGRLSGSAGERCAGEYIAAMFASLGLEPGGEDGYFQELPLASAAQPHAPRRERTSVRSSGERIPSCERAPSSWGALRPPRGRVRETGEAGESQRRRQRVGSGARPRGGSVHSGGASGALDRLHASREELG